MFYKFAHLVLVPLLVAGALGAIPATAASAAVTVRGELLPVPDPQIPVRAVDVSPLGVIAGNDLERPYRWLPVPGAGWVRRQLALPAGATAGRVEALTDAGEAAGSVTMDTVRAARWSLTGRSATVLSDGPGTVTAVGRNGPWGVSTFDPAIPINGDAELVTRGGARTPLAGTPELDGTNRRTVDSIGGPRTALIETASGFGRGTQIRAVLWHNGATLRFPVVGTFDLGPACVSQVQADGSVAYSGFYYDNGVYAQVLVRHVGGVPGTDVTLVRATAADQPRGSLACNYQTAGRTLAADGGLAGSIYDAGGQRAVFWDAANTMTVVPRAADENSAVGVAAAPGGRMVILATLLAGGTRMSLWDDGVRTELPAPAGWGMHSVIELTDAGLLVANVQDSTGLIRPAVWRIR